MRHEMTRECIVSRCQVVLNDLEGGLAAGKGRARRAPDNDKYARF